MPPLALLLALLLQACSSNPPRTDPAYLQQLEQQASDGSFDSAWNAAERLEARNDPRAIHWYERAAATTPWTFRNTRAELALGRIWASGTLSHSDSPHIDQRAALRASPPKAERWYLAAAMHADPYAIVELAKFHRDRGNAAAALRWDLRATVYHRYWSGSSGLPDAVAPRNGEVHPLVRDIQRRAHRAMPRRRSILARSMKRDWVWPAMEPRHCVGTSVRRTRAMCMVSISPACCSGAAVAG